MNIFFDILIAILIISTALPAVILLWHHHKSKESWEYRHNKLSLVIILLLFFMAAVVFYGSFIEPRLLIIKQENIDLSGIQKPIKIALVADLQVGPYRNDKDVKKIVDKILVLNPDMVFLAGDHVNNTGDGRDEIKFLQPFKKLAQNLPVYAIHGNHEYGVSDNASFYDPNYRLPDLSVETKKAMQSLGIKYLVNELEEIKIRDQKFYLFGGDSYWAQKLDLSVLKNRKKDIPTIVLIHNPAAIFDISGYNVDLILAGHTHGGQIRLPFLGPIIPVDNIIPRKWHQGWVDYNNIKMYVTSGAGETGTRARLLTPPEIVLLTIY